METNNINNEKKVANAPLLRFPEFKDEWENTKLGDCFQIGNGKDYKHLQDGDIPVFGTGGFMTKVNDYLMDGETVFIGRKGTINKPFYYKGKFWTVDTLFYTHSFNIIPRFCLYLFEGIDWLKHNEASGVPSLSKSTIEAIKVALPSHTEQQKIADFLSLLDKRIEIQKSVIEKLKSLKSAIRDKIYSSIIKSGETNCRFCDVLNYEQPNKYIVSNTEYSNNSALIPVLTANQAFILGYTDEKSGIYEKGQCIIIDDFTLDCKYVDFNFKVKSSAIKILTAKDNYRLRFLYEYIRFLNLSTTEHKRHYISEIEPMEICMPDENTIIKVASLMKNIDKKAESENRFLKNLINQKNYLLSKMFI